MEEAGEWDGPGGVLAELRGAYWLESSVHELPDRCRCIRAPAGPRPSLWVGMTVFTAATVLAALAAVWWT